MGLFGVDAAFPPFVLRSDGTVEKQGGKDRGRHPLAGVEARVESGEGLHRRITATRVLLTGVFALALRKKAGGTSFLTIEGPGFAWVEEVDRKKKEKAVQFAASVRAAVSALPAEPAQPAAAPVVPAGWYPDQAAGVQRWWDGQAWTEHTAPMP